MRLPAFVKRAGERGFGWRILTLLAAGFLILIVTNGVSLWAAQVLSKQNELVGHTREVRRAADHVERLLYQAEGGQRGFLLTGEPMYAEAEQAARLQVAPALGVLRELVEDNPEQLARLDNLQPLIEERLAITQQVVRDAQEGRTYQGLQVIRSGREADLMARIQQRLTEFDSVEQALLAERAVAARSAERFSFWLGLFGTALVVLTAGLTVAVFGRYIGELSTARAVLDRANLDLERRVRERTADLTAANEEVQRFAYIVSHDLRAPLVNVMGYTSELQSAGKAVERQLALIEDKAPKQVLPEAVAAVREDLPEAIGFIRASTEKMDRLINAILKLSREGRRTLAETPLEMTAVVQAIADSVHHQTEAAGAVIVVEPLPEIDSDRLMIEQVFGNLIDNAVKYLDPARPGRIVVSGKDIEGDRVLFEITDNGRGVAERDHERIFELFRRAGKQDQPGEGLGLAFVRNTVRRLGGSISLSSVLGEGSTFQLNLPKRLGTQEGTAE